MSSGSVPNTRRVARLALDGRQAIRDFDLDSALVFYDYATVVGEERDDEQLIEEARTISLETALAFIGKLSCLVERKDGTTAQGQLHLISRLGLPESAVEGLKGLVAAHPERPIFVPQQIASALRFALKHCDDRPEEPARVVTLMKIVLAAADDPDPDTATGDPEALVSYLLRQSGLHSAPVMIYAMVRQAELLTTAWEQRWGAEDAARLDSEFRHRTGLSIIDHIRASFSLLSHFLAYADAEHEPPAPAVDGVPYLEKAGIAAAAAKHWIDRYSATPEELRVMLEQEEADHGPTSFRSATFDRKPLVRLRSGALLTTMYSSLQKLSYEGAYWESRPPEKQQDFGGQYGKVLESYTQAAIERIAGADPLQPEFSTDVPYGPKKRRVLSSDANLYYDHDWFAFEIVGGRPSIPTMTRGDLRAFKQDVDRLIAAKVRQLNRVQRDALVLGNPKFGSRPPSQLRRYWPVLVLGDGFPMQAPLYGVLQQLADRQAPRFKGQPTLTLIDSDDVAALERLTELGYSFVDVMKRWKRQAPSSPLGTWLMAQPEFADGIAVATHHRAAFAALMEPWTSELREGH